VTECGVAGKNPELQTLKPSTLNPQPSTLQQGSVVIWGDGWEKQVALSDPLASSIKPSATLLPLHPSLFTPNPTPCTLHLTPYTLYPMPYTLHPTPHTMHPASYILHFTPYTPRP